MSLPPVVVPIDSQRENWRSKGGAILAKQLWNAGQFLRALRVQMRFGELTRAPLRLLRLQILEGVVECDWLARAPDPWDIDLPREVELRHAGLQALKDAIDVRALLFESIPQAETAHIRVYRESSSRVREMIISGSAERGDKVYRSVRSLAMRAKLLGFRFAMEDNILHRLGTDELLRVGK